MLASNYVVHKVGTAAGRACAAHLKTQLDFAEEGDKPKVTSEELREESSNVASRWATPTYILSLPTEPLLRQFWKPIYHRWIFDPALAANIDIRTFRFRSHILRYLHIGLNSLVFGGLVIAVVKIVTALKK